MAKYLLHQAGAVFSQRSPCLGASILRRVNHPPESRMREIRSYGSEGGGAVSSPYPYQIKIDRRLRFGGSSRQATWRRRLSDWRQERQIKTARTSFQLRHLIKAPLLQRLK